MHRPQACTYLSYVLLDQYYLYVVMVFMRRKRRPSDGVYAKISPCR